ncbi:type II toxin-antitoxin system HicB family antitoxin, partial [Clostridioides difficile]
MKKDIYVYPAILSYDEDGISVEFPDLPGCYTCGDTTEEALKMSKEALGLHLYGMEEDDDIIPDATTIDN